MRGWDYLSAGNLERGNISLADFDALHPWADPLDDTAELVTEDVALIHLHDGTWRGISVVFEDDVVSITRTRTYHVAGANHFRRPLCL